MIIKKKFENVITIRYNNLLNTYCGWRKNVKVKYLYKGELSSFLESYSYENNVGVVFWIFSEYQ